MDSYCNYCMVVHVSLSNNSADTVCNWFYLLKQACTSCSKIFNNAISKKSLVIRIIIDYSKKVISVHDICSLQHQIHKYNNLRYPAVKIIAYVENVYVILAIKFLVKYCNSA